MSAATRSTVRPSDPRGADLEDVTTHFEITAPAPFRLDLSVWARRRRPGNTVDRWDGSTYRRAQWIAGVPADVAVTQLGPPDRPRLAVTVTTETPRAPGVVCAETSPRLRRMLGLDVDLRAFYAASADDPDLRDLTARLRGLKPPRFPTLFESLANAVACQQLTLTVGIELLNRLATTFGRPAPGSGGAHLFPEPRDLAGLDPDALRPLGFSRQKSLALVAIADRLERGTLSFEDIDRLDDAAATDALCSLRGIGRWSAEYVLLRGLGRLEVFPGDDVGARNNLQRRLGITTPLDYDAVRRITDRWAPYSGLVYYHFLLAGIAEAGWLDPGT
jgi:DNA-3-methyladenine glycosylase II